MSGTTIIEDLRGTQYGASEAEGRSILLVGTSVPSNTDDVGWLFLRVDTADRVTRLYVWDGVSAWKAVNGVAT